MEEEEPYLYIDDEFYKSHLNKVGELVQIGWEKSNLGLSRE